MSGRVVAVVVLGAALVLALVALGTALLREPATPARVTAPPVASLAPDARTADDYARAACVQLRLAAQAVSAGGTERDVRLQLASARALSAAAVRADGRWTALSGGVASLDEAVRRDDGGAAAVGLRVALQECDR